MSKSQKIVLVDIDDTIVDIHEKWYGIVRKITGVDPNVSRSYHTEEFLRRRGVPEEKIHECYQHFDDPHFYDELDISRRGRSILSIVQNLVNDDYKAILISKNIGDGMRVSKEKLISRLNLMSLFDEVIFQKMGDKRNNRGDVLFDDSADNINVFLNANPEATAVIVPWKYNADEIPVLRATYLKRFMTLNEVLWNQSRMAT